MSNTSSSLERTKVHKLAREYETRGYSVVVQPSGSDVPQFLQTINYQPDLIAKSEEVGLIIEVRSRESIKDAQNLANISELVRKHKNWDFLLVYTNPKRKPELSVGRPKQKTETIRESLAAAKTWIERDASHPVRLAAMLFLWSLVEASMTTVLPDEPTGSPPRTPLGLIRDTAIAGLISKKSHHFLEQIMKKRNELAHGNLSQSVSYRELSGLVAVCEELLAEDRT